jgi:hypothetical protein
MDRFFGFFVHQPLRILALAALYFAAWALLRHVFGAGRHHANRLLVPGCFALGFAAWEWLVTTRSPDANIRVDLLAIWAILAILTLWALIPWPRG